MSTVKHPQLIIGVADNDITLIFMAEELHAASVSTQKTL